MIDVVIAVAGVLVCLCAYFVGFARGFRRGSDYTLGRVNVLLGQSALQVMFARQFESEQQRKDLPS